LQSEREIRKNQGGKGQFLPCVNSEQGLIQKGNSYDYILIYTCISGWLSRNQNKIELGTFKLLKN
jgi:hypothetical protein